MPRPVTEKIELPTLSHADKALQSWAGGLFRSLTTIFLQHGQRINTSLNKDGGVTMEAPFPLARYTTATRPDATEWEGAMIYVSDGASGQKFQGSDGTNWVPLG